MGRTMLGLCLLVVLLTFQIALALPLNLMCAEHDYGTFMIRVFYPRERFIGDIFEIVLEVEIKGSTEGFELYGGITLVTEEDHKEGHPKAWTWDILISESHPPPVGMKWTKTFTINATSEGIVVLVLLVRYGKWIEGKPIRISDSVVFEVIPRALEKAVAFAFVLTTVKGDEIKRLKEEICQLKKELLKQHREYAELKKMYENLTREYEYLKGEKHALEKAYKQTLEENAFLRENIEALSRQNTFYSTGFYLLLFATIILFVYCLFLGSRVRSSK